MSRGVAGRRETVAGWWVVLMPCGRPMIPRPYATEARAMAALRDLLQPYPPRHEWRQRVGVVYAVRTYVVERGDG